MPVGVTKTQIKFRHGTRDLTLDYPRVPFAAWGELKKATGFTQKTLVEALGESDLDAVVAVIWLERAQRDRNVRYIDVYHDLSRAENDDEFELLKLVINGRAYVDNEDRDEQSGTPDEEADPTGGS